MKNIVPWIRNLNALMIFVIMGVLASAYYQQYFKHETPCPLCILQRLSMIGVGSGLLLNLRFGIKMKHYILSLFSAFLGMIIAGRQIGLHICPGFPVFGFPVFGLSLYTWSFVVFASSAIAIALFIFLFSVDQNKKVSMNFFQYVAFFAIFSLTLLNFITTFQECGISACKDIPWPQPETSEVKQN